VAVPDEERADGERSRRIAFAALRTDVQRHRLPRKRATKATRDPRASGGGVFHSTDLMFTYHFGALSGSRANAATSAGGQAMMISVTTSTGMFGSSS
jgi:hypothetical protein